MKKQNLFIKSLLVFISLSVSIHLTTNARVARAANEWTKFVDIVETFTAGNLKYAINADSVSIIGYVKKPKGRLYIDEYVEYNGKFYTITAIKDSVFKGCDSLEYASTQWTLHSIGSNAFKNCSRLQGVCIGACPIATTAEVQYSRSSAMLIDDNPLLSLIFIGSHAFQGCYTLKDITVFQKTPPILGVDIFSDVDKSTCSLKVIKGYKSNYTVPDQWKDFTKVSEFSISYVPENETSQATIFTERDVIVVKGAEAGTSITVYSASGIQNVTLTTNGDEQRIALPAGALYLVKVDEQAFKVALLQ